MTVDYRCVGGPLDGSEIASPPVEYTRRLAWLAEARGEEAPVAALFIEGHVGVYVFDDDAADVLLWREPPLPV